jgi:predicted ATPase/DNA-binding SARP family transcriptional activator
MANLQLFLLGPPRLERAGKPLLLETRKAMALLIYLAVSGETYSREALATLFWPEQAPVRARTYLRRALWLIKKAVGSDLLAPEREQVALQDGPELWLDVTHFRRLLAACQQHNHAASDLCADCLPLLAEAASLYRDEFLAGFNLPDCPAFDEWQFFQAEELRREAAGALAGLARGYSVLGQTEPAIAAARRWVTLDPLHEPAQRELMKLYAQAGQRAAALRQYHDCRRLLAETLKVSPEPETVALFEMIKGSRGAREQGGNGAGEQSSSTANGPSSLSPLPNLPAPPTPFVGREEELAEIRRLLLKEPACRLLTLVGPGGSGKTRLALEVAGRVQHHFPDGVFFVSAAAINEAVFLIPAVAQALGLILQGGEEAKAQLLAYLGNKQLLLIIDNFEPLLFPIQDTEHVEQPTGLISELLRAGRIKLLVTSRERLKLQEEWRYRVQGMRFPEIPDDSSSSPEVYSAVRLFIQCARRAEVSFQPTAEDMAAIGRICQRVNGLPLALELAAAWVRSLSCREIAAEIERSLDFLTSSLRNIPERQRSMRAAFEQSWQRLPEAEQAVLSRLSIFSGGCLREAAEAVAGATLPVLSALVDKALLQRSSDGRYELHELIRQFAAEQLRAKPANQAETENRYRAYYGRFLRERLDALKGGRQKEAVVEIAAEIDNVRAAWRQAAATGDIQLFEQSAACLWLFYDIRETAIEAELGFQQAVAALIGTTADPLSGIEQLAQAEDKARLAGFLLAAQGYFCAQRGRPAESRALLEQGLALLRQARQRDRSREAFTLLHLGLALLLQGEYETAQQFGRESLTLFTTLGDRWGIAQNCHLLGHASLEQGQLAQAGWRLQESLRLCREIGDRRLEGFNLQNLGILAVQQGAYVQAQQYLDEALAISREFDDRFGLADTLLELGCPLALAQGDYQGARQTIQEGLAIAGQLGLDWAEAKLNLAEILRLQGEVEAAGRLYQELLASAQAAGHQPLVAHCLSGLGRVAFARQAYHEAAEQQQAALVIWQVMGHEPEMASTLRHLEQIAAALSQSGPADVIPYFNQALRLSLKHRLAPIALDVFVAAARLLAQANETQGAIDLLALARHHPASSYETKEKAGRVLAELIAAIPANLAAPARPQSLDWQAAAEWFLRM